METRSEPDFVQRMPTNDKSGEGPEQQSPFTTTHWSVVLAAGNGQSPGAKAALEELCRAYWYPLYVYARRLEGNPEDASDATQNFLAHLIKSDAFRLADPAKGKFRSFLLNRLKYFLIDEWRREKNTIKRGRDVDFVPLDATCEERYCAEPGDGIPVEHLFDQKWAVAAMERALTLLKQMQYYQAKQPLFEELRPLLAGKIKEAPCQAIAEKLGERVGTIKSEVHRIWPRYLACFRAVIAETVPPEDVDDEIRYLISILPD